jgi:hypothetical protein
MLVKLSEPLSATSLTAVKAPSPKIAGMVSTL